MKEFAIVLDFVPSPLTRIVQIDPETRLGNGFFKNLYSGKRFQKVRFLVSVSTGHVWTKGQCAKKKLRFQMKTGYVWTGP